MRTRNYPFDIFFYREHELVHQLGKDIIIKRSQKIINKIETFISLLKLLDDQGHSDKLITLAQDSIDIVKDVASTLDSKRKAAKYWRNNCPVDKCPNLIEFIRAIYTDNHTNLPDILLSCNECTIETSSSSRISTISRTSSSSKETSTTSDEQLRAEDQENRNPLHEEAFMIVDHTKKKSKIIFEVIIDGHKELRDQDIIIEKQKELLIYMKNLHQTNPIRLKNLCLGDPRLYELFKKAKK